MEYKNRENKQKKLKQNNKLSNLIPTGEFPPPHLSHKVMQQNR